MQIKQGMKGQISMEALLLSVVIILSSIAIFGYYVQIKDITTGMQLIKIEAMKQLDEESGQYVVEEMTRKTTPLGANFCLKVIPEDPPFFFDTDIMEDIVEELTAFDPATVLVSQDMTDCE